MARRRRRRHIIIIIIISTVLMWIDYRFRRERRNRRGNTEVGVGALALAVPFVGRAQIQRGQVQGRRECFVEKRITSRGRRLALSVGVGFSRTPLGQDAVVLVCCTPNRTSWARMGQTSISPVEVENTTAEKPQLHRPTMMAVNWRRRLAVVALQGMQGNHHCHKHRRQDEVTVHAVVVVTVLIVKRSACICAGRRSCKGK